MLNAEASRELKAVRLQQF